MVMMVAMVVMTIVVMAMTMMMIIVTMMMKTNRGPTALLITPYINASGWQCVGREVEKQTAPDSLHEPKHCLVSRAMRTSSFSTPCCAYRRRSDVKPDPEVAPGFEFDFESEPLCRVQLKQMILQEVIILLCFSLPYRACRLGSTRHERRMEFC